MEREFKDKLVHFVQEALVEDVGAGDYTSLSTIKEEQLGEAQLLVKEEGILAGVEVAKEIFSQIDPELEFDQLITDGSSVKYGDIAFKIKGKIHTILKGERLVLNIMQRMSGIATQTAKYVQAISGTKAKVLDTRKTTPLLRFLEKKAVEIGGGANHRFGLYDMILIKDNHVDYAGGISAAVNAAFAYKKEKQLDIAIEVEVRNFEELNEVLSLDAVDRVMFDNFSPEQVKEAVDLVAGRLVTEASGGITLATIADYAKQGVDYISVGALTHSVKSLDLSLKAKLI
ncbi:MULTISPECIES: carboxylating nicotinate-nucleotide diphosphorylase [Sphingobacterium]|jgi:nicotinate-nucleotide pyrophosphorylase (carboxylating)|uniref:carboxylating nicotinate-nucleotide diphosphorylase n=1 Tax=Sphingobacterium TaxID=28453 RepID=UPI000C0BBB47|nr:MULTISPECIES: carboxylating nicotinate-nucleotide diphosphorylase [Sphingobacterium]MCT1532224.1 carboxylating nicotinate-nucleotide diphosphorylase [Sphingobacterium daejeonense]